MSQKPTSEAERATFHTLAFSTRAAAEHAYTELRKAGASADEMSLFVSADAPLPDTEETIDHDIDVGGEVGAGTGSLAGGVGGVLAGLGLLVLPGVGPMLAIGPIAAGLTGAITGGALGGFAGSLVGAGVAEVTAWPSRKVVQVDI